MKTNVIEYSDALRALNEAVKTKGYKYQYERQPGGACSNVRDGEPDCIVGHALVFLGVPVEWFRENDLVCATAVDVCEAINHQDALPLAFQPDAIDLFVDVQVRQDEGMPWGESVTRSHLSEDEWFEFALDQDVPV